jgi:hypothetical protein
LFLAGSQKEESRVGCSLKTEYTRLASSIHSRAGEEIEEHQHT